MIEAKLSDIVVVLIGVVLGMLITRVRAYRVLKLKLEQIEKVIKALVAVLEELNTALRDDRLTREEVERILGKLRELINSLREIKGK